MPNPELEDLLPDRVTVKRPTESINADGETTRAWAMRNGVHASIQPKGGQVRQRPYGMVPEAKELGVFHPDADVIVGDLVIPESGFYAGQRFWVRFSGCEDGDHLIAELELAQGTPDA